MATDKTRNAEKAELEESYKLVFPEHTIQDLGKVLTDESKALGSSDFTKEISKPGSYVELIKRMLDVHSDQTMFIRKALDNLSNTSMLGEAYSYKVDPELVEDIPFTLSNVSPKLSNTIKSSEVDASKAKMWILAANRSIKKIYLYNSGFHIVLKGPSLVEMNLIYNRLEEDINTYGKIFGSIFFLYSDIKIKTIIWEFIESLVVSSNLIDWSKENKLREAVSIHDYQQILLAIGTLMFKTGYEFIHVCTNPECKHTKNETIDLSLLQLTDFSRIPKFNLLSLSENKPIALDELENYRSAIDTNKTVEVDKFVIHRAVPSMSKYLTYGTVYNDEMAHSIRDIKDENIIDQYLRYNYTIIFSPWITKIDVLTEDKEVAFTVTDQANIDLIISELQGSDHGTTFIDSMENYIRDSGMTLTGYLATPCDNCQQLPSGIDSHGFVPFDAQNSFFTMLVMRLLQTS